MRHPLKDSILQALRRHNLLLATSFSTLMLFGTHFCRAEPWVEVGDERIKHHLQVLADATDVKILTSSWPLMWSDIKDALDSIDARNLSRQTLWSYQFLRHELRAANKDTVTQHNIHLSNSPLALGYFGSDAREDAEAGGSFAWMGERFAIKLSAQYVHSPVDDRDYRADGSYASALIGNWALGFGTIDRWWGPGWESSLILSNSARPIPGFFIQRHRATPFETPLLSWLGPWQLTTFMGELENHRHVPDARLWGMRVNFSPLKNLEIGMSRTAQWAGEGRPGGVEAFYNLLLGKDNLDDGNDGNNEPGNQLAGFDARWGFALGNTTTALYAQLIGEDEAGGLPSRHIGLGGIEFSHIIGDIQVRLSLEGQNTTVYFYDDKDPEVVTVSDVKRPAYNSAYEHHIYQSGYRYLGRPIGAATDNDTEAYTARLQLYLANGHHLMVSTSHLLLNKDNSNRGGDGGSVFGANKITNNATTIEYNAPISQLYKLQLGLFQNSTPLSLFGEEIDSGGFIRLQGNW